MKKETVQFANYFIEVQEGFMVPAFRSANRYR